MAKGKIGKGDRITIVGIGDPGDLQSVLSKYEGMTGTVTSIKDRPLLNVRLDNGETGAFCESVLRREP